jgi:cytochrome c-type biogenesis protein CcmE
MTAAHKLCLSGLVLTMATTGLAYLGASSSWRFYLTVDELMEQTPTLHDCRVRLSGKVKIDSLRIASDRTSASFILQGSESQINVECYGTLPDNLTEGIDVVVEGHVENSSLFKGDQVLTRCASKYATGKPQVTFDRLK